MQRQKRWGRVAFIYPYRVEVPMYNFFPPVGLEYVATAAAEIVSSVDLFDLRCEKSLPDLRNYDAVCVSVNWRYEAENVANLLRLIPQNIFTVIGGRQATDFAERYLLEFPNINVVVCGDGDEAIRELATGVPFEKIKGIMFRSNGKIVRTEGRAHKDISLLRFPDRRLRRQNYHVKMDKFDFRISFDVIMTSWGCPFKCKFCALRLDAFGRRRPWSARSPESVIEEMCQIKARWLGIIDENFFVDIARVEQICDLIVKEHLNDKVIGVQARIGIADYPHLLEKMWRAGFRILSIGIESAQDKTLEQLDKKITVNGVRKAFSVFRQFPFLINGYFIVGNIGESEEEIRQILPFAREIGLDFITLNILHYEEHSGLTELLDENPAYHIADSGIIYSDFLSTADLRRIRKSIDKAFYSPSQIWKIIQRGTRAGVLEPGRFFGLLPVAGHYALSKIVKNFGKSKRRRLEKAGILPRRHKGSCLL